MLAAVLRGRFSGGATASAAVGAAVSFSSALTTSGVEGITACLCGCTGEVGLTGSFSALGASVVTLATGGVDKLMRRLGRTILP